MTETTVTRTPYLSLKEAGAAHGIPEDAVRKFIGRAKLRAIKRSDMAIMYTPAGAKNA